MSKPISRDVNSSKPRNRVQTQLNELIGDEKFDLAVAHKLLEGLDCPTSLGIHLCLKYGDLKSVVEHEVNPSNYTNWNDYFNAKQSAALLSKYAFSSVQGINPAQKAKESFLSCEVACKTTNLQIKEWLAGRKILPSNVESALFAARYKIQTLLGRFDPQEWLMRCRFGPGSVHGSSGESDYQKLCAIPSVTPEFHELGVRILRESHAWTRCQTYDRLDLKVNTVPGGKYTQVPKNAKTNRNIETQPLLNSYAQLGIGSMLRHAFLATGNDLNDQTRNQELARLGSLDGSLATMDLSNASDTIATELVRYLLPSDWFFAMDSCRTKRIKFEGGIRPLERFCSMGNGFAFELESLIFWALASCAIENQGRRVRVSVYGDDIIIPSQYFDTVAETLQYCGFSTNVRKSFSSGPFRESCGADWFLGHSVRPFYFKKGTTNVASLVSLANGIKRVAHRFNSHCGYDRRLASAWFHIVRRIPPSIRRRIAFGYTEHDDIILSGRVRDGSSIIFRALKLPISNWYAALATALYRLDRRSGTEFDPDASIRRGEDPVRFPNRDNGWIFDYRRNAGKWSLRKFQHLVDADPTMIWW